MSTEEATINPDGSSTYQEPPTTSYSSSGSSGEELPFNGTTAEETIKGVASRGIDPAFYVLFGFLLIVGLGYFFLMRKNAEENDDDFFTSLDGEKFNLKLPAEVEEYYEIKDKCIEAGWQPGQIIAADANTPANAPSRMIAQALMKRAIADIPIVAHVQKESSGMNKLYSQSMCSVKQWRAYQAAEAMVGAEVDEVRAEADEIEPGWSGAIWRQAMQYHQMLKQKHEMEAKAAEEQAKKRKDIEQRVMLAKAEQQQQQEQQQSSTPKEIVPEVEDVRAKELAAEKAAQELLRAEEREKQSKKAFSAKGGTLKKGFLDSKGKKK